MSNLLKDAKGDTSSKRVMGIIGVASVIIMAGYAIIKDPSQAANVIWPVAITAGALLGVTVLEKK